MWTSKECFFLSSSIKKANCYFSRNKLTRNMELYGGELYVD